MLGKVPSNYTKNLSMGTWEHRNIAGSPPLHNSLGIFCWGRSLKIQREIKREVFTVFKLWAFCEGKIPCNKAPPSNYTTEIYM
jgi:hypothetical protein